MVVLNCFGRRLARGKTYYWAVAATNGALDSNAGGNTVVIQCGVLGGAQHKIIDQPCLP